MVRNLAIAHDVLETRELIGKNCREQIFRFHSLQRRGEFCPAAKAGHSKRARRIPTPANRKHRRVEQCLHEHFAHCFGIQITKNFIERERVLCPERDDDRIVSRRGLQLEIERSTKAFPKCEPPRAIDSVAEGRMQNELHPARFIEEALHHEGSLRRDRAERAKRVGEIIRDLLSRRGRQFQFALEPRRDIFSVAQHFLDLDAQIRNRIGQLRRARRRFA